MINRWCDDLVAPHEEELRNPLRHHLVVAVLAPFLGLARCKGNPRMRAILQQLPSPCRILCLPFRHRLTRVFRQKHFVVQHLSLVVLSVSAASDA